MTARTPSIPPDVLRWAREPGPAAVLELARAKLEQGSRGPGVLVSASGVSGSDRRVLGQVLGLEWQVGGRSVRLGALRRGLEAAGVSLEQLLEALGGALRDRPAERAAERSARADAERRLGEVLVAAGAAEAAAAAAVDGRWLGAALDAEGLGAQAAAVLARLPAAPVTLLAQLASEVLGDPHALDRNRQLGRAVARLHGCTVGVLGPSDRVDGPETWRAVWESAGVTCDRVSSLVLVLNLPLGVPDGPDGIATATGGSRSLVLGRLCAAARGEPLWLTSRLLPARLTLPAAALDGLTVHVCENPSVVEAAADRLGARSAPLVCTYGQVSVAGLTLLRALDAAGATLLVSGDRDEPGRLITARLLDQLPGARPWRPEAPGQFEEDRLEALLADLAPAVGGSSRVAEGRT